MSEIQSLDVRIPEEIIRNWGWLLVFGICLAVLGLVAIIQSIAATKFSMLFIGSLLLLAAAIEIVQAIWLVDGPAYTSTGLVLSYMELVLGAFIIWLPVVTAEILTLLIGAFFLVGGLFQLITPFVVSLPDWGWHAAYGLITLILGIMILAQWPVSGLWVIGMLVGIELVIYGGAWIALAVSLHRRNLPLP